MREFHSGGMSVRLSVTVIRYVVMETLTPMRSGPAISSTM
jgi:hypothetical protein